ncbi:sulfatase family protein [Neorhodopirellula pilleata]|uniref:Arylsulfatase n=1 Tax=Neorhodopirellula pilleata TaxID=2714738 RepID=A0A5C6AS96_9BACT|nr:sulfatase [Neorhodopirellula pilleata]TWU01852.1 Arylsulfatase [Neorhodopirellula pilleata]
MSPSARFCMIAVAIVLSSISPVSAADGNNESRPNFVLIIADDVGFRDIGCYGSPDARTPRLDALAGEGLRMTNAFLTASSCSPSRASIITGRYPHNNGPACELHKPIPGHLPSVTGILRKAGYFTALSGKNHMTWTGVPDGETAPTPAFDRIDNGKPTEMTTRNGGGHARWVDAVKDRPVDQPFMLWLASYDAHRAWDADGQWDEAAYGPMHRPESLTLPPAFMDTPETRQDFASYLNEVTRFDHFVGEVVDALKSEKLWDNTYLFVLADNGRPFPRGKTRLNDDGMQTFLILTGPRISQPGTSSDSLVSVIDIAPTITELAGIDRPETFQGPSMVPLYDDPQASIRPFAFSEHNWHDYEALGRAVRDQRYLYIENDRPELASQGPADSVRSPTHQDLRRAAGQGVKLSDAQADVLRAPRPARELYDRKSDPYQTNNLIDSNEHTEVQTRLTAAMKTWRAETGDSVPDSITPDKFDRDTGESLKLGKKRGSPSDPPPPGHDRDAMHVNREGI